MIKVSIVGASGYVGGELLRLLLAHPHVEVHQATSQRYAGRSLREAHPNLRGVTSLKFIPIEELAETDFLFLCLPHGKAADEIERFTELAEHIIDCSADFRLRDPAAFEKWYGKPHANPEYLSKFVYGLPEMHREELKSAKLVSGVGCNATASNLAMLPLAKEGLIEKAVIEVKVGSSEGGNAFNLATHHPERVNVVRSFAPTGHRHQAEILQELGEIDLHFSATAVELVRGVLCTAHVFCNQPVSEKDLWKKFREAYADEPFVRIVKEKRGVYRYPEPKILSGTNFAEVGFEVDESTGRVVLISAIDNLMKGAAGSALQCMNLMLGFEETTALEFFGLHPY